VSPQRKHRAALLNRSLGVPTKALVRGLFFRHRLLWVGGNRSGCPQAGRQTTGNLFVAVGGATRCKGVRLDPGGEVTDASDVANCLLYHAARPRSWIWIDVEVDLHLSLRYGMRQAQVEVCYLIDFIHETQVRSIGSLIKIAFAGGLPEEFAAPIAIDVHHDHQRVVGMPDLRLQEPARVGSNINFGGGRLRCNKSGHRRDVEFGWGVHVGVHSL
jgi:hypothetical protein